MQEFMKVLKLIEVQHLEIVSTSKRKRGKHGKVLFIKRNKKAKL